MFRHWQEAHQRTFESAHAPIAPIVLLLCTAPSFSVPMAIQLVYSIVLTVLTSKIGADGLCNMKQKLTRIVRSKTDLCLPYSIFSYLCSVALREARSGIPCSLPRLRRFRLHNHPRLLSKVKRYLSNLSRVKNYHPVTEPSIFSPSNLVWLMCVIYLRVIFLFAVVMMTNRD